MSEDIQYRLRHDSTGWHFTFDEEGDKNQMWDGPHKSRAVAEAAALDLMAMSIAEAVEATLFGE